MRALTCMAGAIVAGLAVARFFGGAEQEELGEPDTFYEDFEPGDPLE